MADGTKNQGSACPVRGGFSRPRLSTDRTRRPRAGRGSATKCCQLASTIQPRSSGIRPTSAAIERTLPPDHRVAGLLGAGTVAAAGGHVGRVTPIVAVGTTERAPAPIDVGCRFSGLAMLALVNDHLAQLPGPGGHTGQAQGCSRLAARRMREPRARDAWAQMVNRAKRDGSSP